MTYITTHNNHIIGIHQSESEANAYAQKDEQGKAAVLNVLNVELPLNAETGWYCNVDGSVIDQFAPFTPDYSNSYTKDINSRLVLINAIMRSSNTPISMLELVNDINPIHRNWLITELKDVPNNIATTVINLFFDDNLNYLPVDTVSSLTQSELDVRIVSLKSAVEMTKNNAKKWSKLEPARIERFIRLADTHAFPPTQE